MGKASKKKAKKASAKKQARKIPRQTGLPGIQDAKITAIENLALDYAEIRDQRQELSKQESDLKQALIKLMHKAGKEEYKRNGISVVLQVEEETVKVRVREDGEMPTAKAQQAPEEDPEPVDQPDEEPAYVEEPDPSTEDVEEDSEEARLRAGE